MSSIIPAISMQSFVGYMVSNEDVSLQSKGKRTCTQPVAAIAIVGAYHACFFHFGKESCCCHHAGSRLAPVRDQFLPGAGTTRLQWT